MSKLIRRPANADAWSAKGSQWAGVGQRLPNACASFQIIEPELERRGLEEEMSGSIGRIDTTDDDRRFNVATIRAE